tara:strand:- start:2063 stop:2272 length:210 start_codon:yes stop_codon:yes gene_type:complete
MMKIEYDKTVDAAYIYIKSPIKNGEVKESKKVKPNVVLDYDKEGRLLGVEFLNASKTLNKKGLSTIPAI